ncbi:uncharacterized protein LOC121733686 [Aricia agestis]|uniref:uncharacterized protein LOC121733686 n=1 Tax=Aricia agestis TaxID=91739 RepID=UPI001C2065D5|nr:uncharacterized protein LOC121733686 [Aricia agestis]
MSSTSIDENVIQPKTLQEALNYIKFLKTSHKQEKLRMREAYVKLSDKVKQLESSRKVELEYLSSELQKYELNLALRTESIKKQIRGKDEIINNQQSIIDDLNEKLRLKEQFTIPQINVHIESNSDSGVALDNEELLKSEQKPDSKPARKCSRRFGETISFLRRVDFSPMKYKPNREAKKKDDKKKKLEVPNDDKVNFHKIKVTSDDDRPSSDIYSDGVEQVVIKPKKMNDSMNNHFSDDGSEDTSEEIFDRVMTRSSIRRSVKANPKYKKINRTKSKLLGQVKVNIGD